MDALKLGEEAARTSEGRKGGILTGASHRLIPSRLSVRCLPLRVDVATPLAGSVEQWIPQKHTGLAADGLCGHRRASQLRSAPLP